MLLHSAKNTCTVQQMLYNSLHVKQYSLTLTSKQNTMQHTTVYSATISLCFALYKRGLINCVIQTWPDEDIAHFTCRDKRAMLKYVSNNEEFGGAITQ